MTYRITTNSFKVFIIALFASYMVVACHQQPAPVAVAKVERDTSITVANSYSQLFTDSIALENFIGAEVTSDSIANYMRNFYNARNYSFAWFNENGLTLQAQGFWNAHDNMAKQPTDSSVYDKQLHEAIDTLTSGDSTYKLPKSILALTEFRFTKHFFKYVQAAYGGKVDPENVQWFIPRRKLMPLAMLDSFLNSKPGDWKPLSKSFGLLENRLVKYKQMQQKGGWPTITVSNKKYKLGNKDAVIQQVKKRLQYSGDYMMTDTSNIYSDTLLSSIKKIEESFGLATDGVINKELISRLNITVGDRIKQLLVNLERMKWMPEVPSNFLLANIPEYRLHVVENGKEVLSMGVVVGQAVHQSVIFSNELKYVVFSPYWNIPRSIVKAEIYPAMQRNRNYLKEKNMEVTGYSGGLPIVRQKPGGNNALGHVKFIFPNSYSIYFHDTPSRSLFSREQRAFSHGCIRLHHPYDLAVYLLRNQPEWTPEKIKAAMDQSTEKWVGLNKPVAVFITYFTAWVDQNGVLHFVDDIYGHDKELAEHLFKQ